MTPAKHLLLAAHGSADAEAVRASCFLHWSSVKPATRAAYGRDVIKFLAWCDEIGLPTHFRFPTAANILLVYLQRDLQTLRASTVTKRAHGLLFWHRVQRMPWSLDRADTRTLEKAARIESLPPLEKRRPVRLNDLTAMHLQHNPNDPAHVAILAAAFMAFYAMCRPGEVTVRVVSRPHNDRPRWTHLVEYPPTAPDGPSSFGLKLPSDKTHGKTGFDRIAAEQRRMPSLCPVAAVRRHLVTNALAPGERGEECGAFSFRARNGGRRELGESLFVRTINAWLIAANRERITGHCFRIGGATLFFGAGKDLADIRLRGGWESDTYLVYLRDNFVRHAAMFGDVDPTALFYG
ncbi:hypothetical protein CF326_g7079 [Tilletia indica]|nr:hypothetical protein CF326_g7079 [Tilletia indica]